MREYFDRDLPDPEAPTMRPARASQQETYSYLRSCLMQVIGQELPQLRNESPHLNLALGQLERFKAANPYVEFAIFRPEDLDATDSAGSRLFLR